MKHVWTPPNTVRPTLMLVYIPNSRYIMYYSYSALFFLCVKSIFLLYHDISLRGTWANIVVGLCYFLSLSSVVMQVRRTSSLDWRLSRRVNQVIATYNDTKRIIHVVVQLWKFRLPLDTEKTRWMTSPVHLIGGVHSSPHVYAVEKKGSCLDSLFLTM